MFQNLDVPNHCFIIAEIGVNHNGDMEMAKELIDASARAGADAVKFQTFFADDLVTPQARSAEYQERNTKGQAKKQYDMLKELELTEEQFIELADHCQKAGIRFLSTPFGEDASDLLERVGVEAFKISSGDLTHLPFLAYLARKGLPMILSTGMGSLSEVEAAVETIAEHGDPELALLHCVSNYPADPAECNLAAIGTLSRAFRKTVGWSDHTEGAAISHAAVALGARVIEKHITLSKSLPGPDHLASMEVDEFIEFVRGIRDVEMAIGDGRKRRCESEQATAQLVRRSLVAKQAFTKGHVLRREDIAIMRPGDGLPPAFLEMVVGLTLARDVPAFKTLTEDDLHG